MDELIKKLTQLTDLLKAIKQPSTVGSVIPTIPAIRPPAQPSLAPKSAPAKIPGVAPSGKKDPKKIAQQIKDGSMSTKTQKVMLKTDKNGQWSLEDDSKSVEKVDPHSWNREPTDPSSI